MRLDVSELLREEDVPLDELCPLEDEVEPLPVLELLRDVEDPLTLLELPEDDPEDDPDVDADDDPEDDPEDDPGDDDDADVDPDVPLALPLVDGREVLLPDVEDAEVVLDVLSSSKAASKITASIAPIRACVQSSKGLSGKPA